MRDVNKITNTPGTNPSPTEIDAGSATQDTPESTEAGFDPLYMCPPNVRSRFERRAKLAAEQPMRAIELKCIECCGWSRPDAAGCEIRTCPLWAIAQQIFKRRPEVKS